MSLGTNKRVADWARWFHYHKDQVGRTQDLEKMEEFYTKAIDGLIELTALLARDVGELEKRTQNDGFQGLYLPKGVKMNEALRSE